jgi:dTDP-4-amino-4,6-dideoxygalactose transaminase
MTFLVLFCWSLSDWISEIDSSTYCYDSSKITHRIEEKKTIVIITHLCSKTAILGSLNATPSY